MEGFGVGGSDEGVDQKYEDAIAQIHRLHIEKQFSRDS